ncbi:putative thiamine transport system substrate-binding protein [Rhizobium sp. RU20A]|uniref:ABC transporter substrate-binding protein n=1 Tax=Rhizobium sp. RU20A TaxID=1907412 RepID=UPI000955A2A9|nr:ABC transporter substrate-binding protein [Rhizobium sp. RU20A]SIR18764.1 putative thiamine transport system substrate-binding protein [Rhizobium sp. RU20A]
MRFMKAILAAGLIAGISGLQAIAADAVPKDWPAIEKAASGQTVYFNAWGGSENINAYLEWVGGEMQARYGVTVVQVKLDDTASAVAKVIAEKAAGKNAGGSVDLIWINGENFVSMKQQGLLMTPGWATSLPNWRYVDVENQPTILTDFTEPTEGLESPWGGAKMVFFYDSARTDAASLPDNAVQLLDWAKAHPGRFSYPAPPDFVGSSFLKQVLSEVIDDPARLARPVDEQRFERDVEPLFAYLDQLHAVAWRSGKAFPQNYPDMKQKLADGELDIIFAFNPAEASAGIRAGELPDTVRSFTFSGGTLGNTHFVAIPYNANAREGALLTANFLLSPEAQLRKQDPAHWGDPTVLAMSKLPQADRAAFAALDLGVATLTPDKLGPVIAEPHASWMERIEAEWRRRYASGN